MNYERGDQNTVNFSKKFISKNRISLKIISYNKSFIYFFIHKLRKSIKLYKIFKLPNRKSLYTILRSPFVNKKSRIQLGFSLHSWKFFLDYYDFNANFVTDRLSINDFILNNFKKNLTSKYSIKVKIYRSSFFF